ncbi:MAG: sulfatase-like hydrolase/transferase [Planctomycetota bacterium]
MKVNDRPNILFITSDQHRADTLGCAGHPCVQTPHLDLLAYQGVRFDNAYVDCPVCIPARTALITGRRAHENGMPAYADDFRVDRRREDFLGSRLTAAGYQTELVGKTHWHTEPDFRAGFEHVTWMAHLRQQQLVETGRAGLLTGLGYNEMPPSVSPFPRHLYQSDWCVDRAIDFLSTRERAQPFALWLSLQDPHPPLTIHEPYYSMYRDADIPAAVVPDWVGTDAEPYNLYCLRHVFNKGPATAEQVRAMRAVYYGMVTNLDHQLGRLLAQLQMDGDLDETLIVYTSDHGEALGDFHNFAKSLFYESQAKVPFIVRPPASWETTPGRVTRDLIEWVDVLPTLCDVAGIEAPEDVTGRSLVPALRGEAMPAHQMHGQIDQSHMLHDGRFKYLYCVEDGSEQCFDTENDPHDEHPVAGEPLDRLREILTAHLIDEQHPHVRDGEPANLHRDRPPVNQLRARDYQGLGPTQHLGDIRRSVLRIN